MTYPNPKCVKDVRRLLGLAGWYRRFIPDFSDIVSPLTDLTKNSNAKFMRSGLAEQALAKIKTVLTTEPILSCPDYTKLFIVQFDASEYRNWWCSRPRRRGKQKNCGIHEKKLNSAQRKYQTTERES